MKKIILGLLLILILVGCENKAKEKNTVKKKLKIGITQIMEHPSLEAIRAGIMDAIERSKYKNQITFNYKNARGDSDRARDISTEFNKEEDIIVAISTPSAQAAAEKIHEKPVFFAAVTNPSIAGLTGKNITGVSDMSSPEEKINLIKELLPKAKTIGIIYSSDEDNSVYTTKEFIGVAIKRGYKVIAKKILKKDELVTSIKSMSKKIDVLYTGQDNKIASNYSLIVKEANEVNLPIIGATKDFTRAGALGASGVSEYLVGLTTGEMIVKYLDGMSIKDLPTEYLEFSELTVNKEQMKRFNIKLNNEQKKIINIIKVNKK